MKSSRSQLFLTLLLTAAALVFGMILTGGSQLTTPGYSAPAPQEVPSSTTAVALPSFADLAEAVVPAVVTVRSTTIESTRSPSTPFDFFFGPRQQVPEEFRSDGAGSGFVIDPEGWIVTNNHVVEGATTVRVILNERTYEAQVKGRDPETDLALLKVDAGGDLAYLALGDSEALRVGDWVMAVGSPLFLTQSVTVGVVSAKERNVQITADPSFENLIQTDAAINRGNSGGPLVNLSGEVVGINTAMNFGAENIGFAVPVNTLTAVVDQLRETGRVRRGYLGVNITNLDHEAAQAFGVESTDGALVQEVVTGSPADSGGLRNGDIIVSVDGRRVQDTRGLIDYVGAQPPGTEVEVGILRNGKRLEKKILLEERESLLASARVEPQEESELEWLGMQYQNLTPGLRQMHQIPGDVEGVWITEIAPVSPLIEETVRPGDVIVEVNGQRVAGAQEFEEAVAAEPSGAFLRLYLRRFSASQGDDAQGYFAIVRKP